MIYISFLYEGIYFKSIAIILILSLYFRSFNRKYLKLTKMDLSRFAKKTLHLIKCMQIDVYGMINESTILPGTES